MSGSTSEPIYFPTANDPWERRAPDQVGLNPKRLAAAVEFAVLHETPWDRDLHAVITNNNRVEGAHGAIIGPTRPRGGVNGLVLRHGYIVAE